MRSKTIFGALLVSVALCSQGFSFELLDRMLGLNGGGCGECKACAKVAPCDPCAKVACPEPCAKACPKVCEQACPKVCDPTCGELNCGKCKRCRPTPVRDLFGGLKDLFEAKGCYCETKACEAAKGCCPEPCAKACPKVCEKACMPACEPACKVKKCRKVRCEKACDPCCPVAACDPGCEPACQPKCHKLYRRPVIELLDAMFGNRKCGQCGGCNTGCDAGCGCGGAAPVNTAPAKTPAKAPEQAAPLPQAPKADPSASLPRGIYQASRTLVRN
jgi:hypothetical protein